MNMNYSISDCIIRIKNAVFARRKKIVISDTKLNRAICRVLIKEGFLEDMKETNTLGKKTLVVVPKYEKRIPVLTDVLVISKPSLRIYTTNKNISLLQRGMYTVILSTNQGVMSGRQAHRKGLGGEVLFKIW